MSSFQPNMVIHLGILYLDHPRYLDLPSCFTNMPHWLKQVQDFTHWAHNLKMLSSYACSDSFAWIQTNGWFIKGMAPLFDMIRFICALCRQSFCNNARPTDIKPLDQVGNTKVSWDYILPSKHLNNAVSVCASSFKAMISIPSWQLTYPLL